jgi:sRNA-binding protein
VHYLRVTTQGTVRLDLAAESAGIVTAAECKFASTLLERISMSLNRHRPACPGDPEKGGHGAVLIGMAGTGPAMTH